MAPTGSDPTLGTSSTIGRYLGLVSTVPSLLFWVWVYAILDLLPFAGPPDPGHLVQVNPVNTPSHAVALAVAALITAVVTHPLQTVTVQAMEGYWGTSIFGRRAAAARILIHLRDRAAAQDIVNRATRERRGLTRTLPAAQNDYLTGSGLASSRQIARDLVAQEVAATAAAKKLAAYPEDPIDTMPTRLGNALRAAEVRAGAAIELDVIQWSTHVGLVARPEHNAYLTDQRSQLDLAVRLSAMASIAAAFTFLALWPHGLWLFLALVPLGAAWMSYLGAVGAAASYGRAFTAWLHLNRFALYDALHLVPVADANAEQVQNGALQDLILGNASTYKVTYAVPTKDDP